MRGVTRRAQRVWRAISLVLQRVPLAALILVLGLLLTASATGYVARQVAADERTALDNESAAIQNAIDDRLAHYLDALEGARGLFAASAVVDRAGWAAYIRALDLQARYPGTRSIAYARWVPAADEANFLAEMRADGIPEYAISGPDGAAAYAPLTYVEPLSAEARGALGFDAFADPVRRPALERARDTGRPAATTSTALASETGGAEQRSIILYVPVYRGGGVPETVAGRRAALQGFVLTGWRMDDLIASLFGSRPAAAAFVIADDPEGSGQLLYASDGAGAATTAAAIARPDLRRTLDVAGRTWTLGFVARSGPNRRVPALVAARGAILSLMLALLTRVRGLRHKAEEATRFRALLEAAPDAIVTVDGVGRIVLVNTQAEWLFDYPRAQLLGQSIGILLPTGYPAVPQPLQPGYGLALVGHRRDGSEFPVEVSYSPLATPGGTLLISAIRDVTARKAAETGRREAAESFASLFAASEAITINEQGRVITVNPAYTALLGWTPADLVGSIGVDLVIPEDRTDSAARVAANDERPYTVRLRHKDGTTVPVEVVGRTIRYHGRSARLATLRDVTMRARAEAALHESEERFRGAFEHAAIGKALVAPDGRWLRVNHALCILLGYTEAELLTTNYPDLTYPADLDADLEYTRQLLAGTIATYQVEKRFIHKAGHLVWALGGGSLVRDDTGRPLYFIAQMQDLTARKHAEVALDTRTRELEAKTREQEVFLYTVAHDLRAPLLSMQGMANILIEDYTPHLGDGQIYVERIVANAGRMQALLDGLLEISRVGRIDNDFEPVALDAVVADVCAQLDHTLTARGARVDVAGQLPIVRANRTRMVQLFTNLIVNAVYYTSPERLPLVRIGATAHQESWEITVADNGVGIPSSYRDKVFGLFQRLPAGKTLNPGGTGAGLAIVARIVDTHEGTLWFEAAEGGGTTFHITLPTSPG